jgi:hypothetical protein
VKVEVCGVVGEVDVVTPVTTFTVAVYSSDEVTVGGGSLQTVTLRAGQQCFVKIGSIPGATINIGYTVDRTQNQPQ